MPDHELDPSRLSALAKARDTRRAYVKQLSEKYQDTRAHRADVQRRLAVARQNAEMYHGFQRVEADNQIAALVAEERELTDRLAEIQAETDATSGEAQEAGQLYRACLSFAVDQGLPIPPSLAADAATLNRIQMPMAMPGGAS